MKSELTYRDNGTALNQLRQSLRREQYVLVIGAGISSSEGYPSWGQLLERLSSLSPGAGGIMPGENQDAPWLAERLAGSASLQRKYLDLLNTTFSPKRRRNSSALSCSVARLKISHVLTTNYDTSLEQAYRRTGKQSISCSWEEEEELRDFFESLARIKQQKVRILHVHGHYQRPGSIVLRESDYVRRYIASSDAPRKLYSLFLTRRVLFVGFSLTDPDLMAIVRESKAAFASVRNDARHFAIIHLPVEKLVEEKLLRQRYIGKYGVNPIFYTSPKGNHDELLQLLNFLRSTRSQPSMLQLLQRGTPPPVSSEIDPDDPQKNRWGSASRNKFREITANVREISEDWYGIDLRYKRLSGRRIGRVVEFHLHPTFSPDVELGVVSPDGNEAKLQLKAYGSFTVGVREPAPTGQAEHILELDLSTLPVDGKFYKW
ncbi:MAG: SIR2 family protein [Candidatus Sumerlaeaceae bacterium]